MAYEGTGYGVYVATGDLDGDGKAEIITGLGPGPRNKSVVRIFRGDGTLTGEFQAYPDYMRFGVRVSGGGVGE
ncbi:MAG: FG-GAP repeat protein [Proteobacteria bacterium]|nr:FG-GAP repeat protein [Pseudomonadota bacterium]